MPRLAPTLADLSSFILTQARAALFGGLMLAAILVSKALWQDGWTLARYDALLLFALLVQALFLRLGLETWEEARVILLFHLTGTAMEWFKVTAGSWAYPEPGLIRLFDVPLFSGFMYAAVGSYMLRVIRLFEMRFTPYPPFGLTVLLAGAIYVNFFAHHYLPDIRVPLLPRPSCFLPAAAGGAPVGAGAVAGRNAGHDDGNLALCRTIARNACVTCQARFLVSAPVCGLRHRHTGQPRGAARPPCARHAAAAGSRAIPA